MIVSYSNNFVVVRPAKTGSTSLVLYFLNSGLVELKEDLYTVEGDLAHLHSAGMENASGIFLPENPYHVKFSTLVEKNLVQEQTPCVSTIRNPLNRLSSAYYHIKTTNAGKPYQYANPNIFWDALKNKENGFGIGEISRPQADYFPEHAELFNTENLHEHVSKYILERGGKVDGRIEMRKNPDNKLDVFLAELTPDRKQDILDTYAKDFELWEKAYAVYN